MKSFGMAAGQRRTARQFFGKILQKSVIGFGRSPPVHPVRLAGQTNGQLFRLFLLPSKQSPGAGHGDPVVILVTDTDLRSPDQRPTPVAQLTVGGKVIIQTAPFDKGFEVSGHPGTVQARQVPQHHQGMGC